MSAPSSKRINEIKKVLNGSELVWFGTRGIDAEPLMKALPLSTIVSQIAPILSDNTLNINQDCLETRTRRRVDLDRYDIDFDFTNEAMGLKLNILRDVSSRTALIAYRPAEFLASVAFTNPLVHQYSPFHLTQRQLEHKPWVERQFERIGIPILSWQYARDGDIETIKRCLEGGPLVGRTNTGAGGAGIIKFDSIEDFQAHFPVHYDGFLGLTPYLDGAIPMNVNACVYYTGEVHVFPPSLQLIGIRECTTRELGYCGNDYVAAGALPSNLHDEIEHIASKVGKWLRKLEYLGVFGLDYMIHNEKVVVTELNPRFQGSTPLCAELCQFFGWPDPFTEHVAAYAGLTVPRECPGCENQNTTIFKSSGTVQASHIVYHNKSPQAIRVRGYQEPDSSSAFMLKAIPEPNIYVENHAIIMKSVHRRQVTENGYTLINGAAGILNLIDFGY